MSRSIVDAIALLADRQGVELPPDWRDGLKDEGGLDEVAAAEILCARLGWKPPRPRRVKPRPGDLPMLIFEPGRGWAVAEQWETQDVIRIAGARETNWHVADAAFIELALPDPRREVEGGAIGVFRRALLASRSVLASAVIATITVNLIALGTSLYSMQVYDRVIPRSGYSTLWVLTVGVLIALVLDFTLRTVRSLMIEKEASRIDAEVSEFFFARAQAIRLDARPPGVGTTAAQLKGWEQIRGLLSSASLFVLADLPFALFFILVMASLGGPVAMVPILSLPLSLGLAWLIGRMIRADAARSQVSGNRRSGMLVEALDAAETVKANRGGWHLLARWNRLSDQIQMHEEPVRRWSSISASLFSSIQQMAYILLVAWGAVLVSKGEMTMGALIACTILSGRVNGPLIGQLPGLMVQWGYARSSLQALDALMTLPLDQKLGAKGLRPERLEPDLAADALRFAYADSPAGVEVARLDIGAGERVAIVGGVGSGKSTLLKLLSGLYAPREGMVTLGGLEMGQLAPEALRRRVGYLPQDTRLLNGTLRENVLLGLADPGDEALAGVLEEVGLATVVATHPLGVDLPIAEGGRGLSGGQRTLANLARLFLADADVWLLDEPTANLDQASEVRVLNAVRARLKPGRTLVVVTHRMQLLSLVDRVVVMSGGRIVSDGPVAEVLESLREQARLPVKG